MVAVMRPTEWTRLGGTTNALGASEEAELLELGRRVAQERGYQSVLSTTPPNTPDGGRHLTGSPPWPTSQHHF
jgi:hypothetical protein